MFLLGGGGGHANDTTQGGRIGGNTGTSAGQQRRPSFDSDWEGVTCVPHQDDTLAPNMTACFGGVGDQTGGIPTVFDFDRRGGVTRATPLVKY